MISDSKKFIFLHIPKTGGNSLTSTLAQYSRDKVRVSKHKVQIIHGKVHNYKHKTLDNLIKMHKDTFDDYFKFTIVRNPYDRLMSYVNYYKGQGGINNTKIIAYYINYIPTMKSFIGDHKIDYILKTENLSEDFNHLCKLLNIINPPILKKINVKGKFNKDKSLKYLKSENIEILNKRFVEDFEFFGYDMIKI